MHFRDRTDAGRLLAERLRTLRDDDPVVVGLPRGGVPVAALVATELGAPLDVLLVRKLGVPVQPELAMGAIGEDGVLVVNEEVVRAARISPRTLADVRDREEAELARRAERYRAGRRPLPLRDRTVVIVDDGIATGSTVRAACGVARQHGARRIVVAAPVASASAVRHLGAVADDVVVLDAPESFFAIGQFYDDFSPTEDDEVVALLAAARAEPAPPGGPPPGGYVDDEVAIDVDGITLAGHLTIPPGAPGIVVFAHGSGSSRHSPRNKAVARALEADGLGTLLLDLLTPAEADNRGNVFDIALLASRLEAATRWLQDRPEAAGRRIGYFGASTGAAAALVAAATLGPAVEAVVSRGGRPDLAGPAVGDVEAPVLLLVGSRDVQVLELTRAARAQLHCPSRLEIVQGATHLFEEPGALEVVAERAGAWFSALMTPVGQFRP